MAETEAKWYVAHTYSGYENKVKADLEKTIENRNLEDTILEVSVPTMEVVEVRQQAQLLAGSAASGGMNPNQPYTPGDDPFNPVP